MASGIADAGRHWERTGKLAPLPVQALDHATRYLMAAAVLRGLAIRQREQVGVGARLSLARTALELTAGRQQHAGEVFQGVADGDWAEPVEHTVWGPARRLRSPVPIGDVALAWDKPACGLGADQSQWRHEGT